MSKLAAGGWGGEIFRTIEVSCHSAEIEDDFEKYSKCCYITV